MKRIMLLALAMVVGWSVAARGEQKLQLWLYYGTNLLVDKNVDELEKVWRRAAAAGYTHVMLTDSKFAKLGDMGENAQRYFANLERTKKIATDLRLQLVPCLFDIGYSNSLLWHDPNLAEGLPVKDQLFVVHNGEARLVGDPPVSFGPRMTFKDDCVRVEGGVASLADTPGNARFVYKLNVPPFRCYHIAVKIKTADFLGQPQIEVLAGDHNLQYQSLQIKPTQDWQEEHVVFNSLDHAQVNVYFGVWGPARGSLQWKDWKIEEVGLLNVLRRPGTPCVVKLEPGGRLLREGTDYEPIADARMGCVPWKGEYEVFHESPPIKTRLAEGTKLRVSWYHPAIVYDGQVCVCLGEEETRQLLQDEARRVKAAFAGAAGYMMSFDEMRVANWDAACDRHHEEPGEMLAETARYCTKLLAPSPAYVWSDMFDPNHNAVKDYYLVHGDLGGSWEGLGRDVIVVNWNFEHRDASLKFFAGRGHKQIIAGYYDGPVQRATSAWLESAKAAGGVVGIMYTTWQHKFDDLEAFARAVRP